MKTRNVLLLCLAVTVPFVTMAACNGDNSNQTDSGPHNGQDTGPDTQPQNDAAADTGTDGGSCSTGLSFDNTLVPGWPNNIPQP
jgi:hypothetical protein